MMETDTLPHSVQLVKYFRTLELRFGDFSLSGLRISRFQYVRGLSAEPKYPPLVYFKGGLDHILG